MSTATLTNSIIDDFAEAITVIRDVIPQSNVNGVVIPGKIKQFTCTASVQPLKGQELLMFAEADRLRQSIKLYTYVELALIDEVLKTKADMVQYNNTLFEIVSVERWVDGDFIYYKSIARRKDRS